MKYTTTLKSNWSIQYLHALLRGINPTGLRLNFGRRVTAKDVAEAVRWEREHT